MFRVFGVDVYLHWSWIVVAAFQVYYRANSYHSPLWKGIEYLALFLIVLLHEFGHSLACRQVGGQADRIMLWPLGGVAYVKPPERPGAQLWSIAAGPLVNVALAVVLFALLMASPFHHKQLREPFRPDGYRFLLNLNVINLALLVFNLLPIYPLDGGQTLRSLLWFPMGKARSLFVVSVTGFAGVALLAALALFERSIWMGLIAFFVFLRCRLALKQAQRLTAIGQLPKRTDCCCPTCSQAPPTGEIWRCGQCRAPFDPFANDGVCQQCQTRDDVVQCADCKTVHSLGEWRSLPEASGGEVKA
ncbi:MAG: M50 family metallopeptidase [Chthoniobacter sp.]|nr:M50 family metallopeptidase [Chthoniobacter sp.]